MAERTRFKSYLIYTFFISALIYPVSGHWIWGGGWLAKLGFHNFAGSTVVHSVGGWAAFLGAAILGPRVGKYVRNNGSVIVKALPGHNIPLAVLGVFILWFGWYGFNAGSTLSGISVDIARVAVTTTLAGSAGALSALVVSWLWFKKPDASMTMNGVLAGLVAITAPCAVVSPGAAIAIGLSAGIIVVASVEFIDKKLRIDDPAGAVSVHMANGIFGTLVVGIWGTVEGVAVGILHGGGWGQLGIQALGVVSVGAWATSMSLVLFLAIKAITGLRVTADHELVGLDLSEHNAEAYSGFQIFSTMKRGSTKVKLIIAYIQPQKLNEVKQELYKAEVYKISITNALGCGQEQGYHEIYRGIDIEVSLLKKVRLEIAVNEIFVQKTVAAIIKGARSGEIGDGKIFVTSLDECIRIRTGESGHEAIG